MSASNSPEVSLPPNPSFRHLQLEAKELLKRCRKNDAAATARVQPFQENPDTSPKLSDAQLAVARKYGFASWTKLKIHVENAATSFAERLDLLLSEGWSWGDNRRAAAVIDEEPSLSKASIYAACVATDHEAVRAFLEKDPKLATTKGGPKKWPPILYATWTYRLPKHQDDAIRVIQLLLEHGADPNAFWKEQGWNKTKESALYGCVDANCDRAAKLLLEAGADPNDGESLYHACEKENLAMLRALGDHGLKEQDVSYCIKHAMDFRWDTGIEWFLEMGADPNAVHPAANETSLHWAVKRNCSLETIQALLAHGADPNAKTKQGHAGYLEIKGWTPLDFSLRLGRREVTELLREAGGVPSKADLIDQFVLACANGDDGKANRLVAANPALPQSVSPHDIQLVTHVAQVESWDGVRLMVKHGWKADQEGGWMGATPLHWAACWGESNIVAYLIDNGARPNHDVGGYFGTPLNTVLRCRWSEGQHAAILRQLLAENVPIPEGWFPCGNSELDLVWRESLK